MTSDLVTLEEGAFTFAGTNDTGPKWKGTVVLGNMLGTFGGQSVLHQGFGYAEGVGEVYLQDFSVKFDSSIVGLNFNAEVGRVGYKVSPYMFQRIDNTPYFSNERWDDGLYRFDGGILGFSFGSTKVDVFAGNNDNITSTGGTNINPIVAGGINGIYSGVAQLGTVDRTLGVDLRTPLTSNGTLNLAYSALDGHPESCNHRRRRSCDQPTRGLWRRPELHVRKGCCIGRLLQVRSRSEHNQRQQSR